MERRWFIILFMGGMSEFGEGMEELWEGVGEFLRNMMFSEVSVLNDVMEEGWD